MTTSAKCPVCFNPQVDGIACHDCVTRLERALGDVPAIVADLDVALSKMARIGSGGTAGLARERTPVNIGAMQAGDVLANTLTTWVRDVSADQWRPQQDRVTVVRAKTQPYVGPFHPRCNDSTCERMRLYLVDKAPPVLQQVSLYLLSHIPEIRRHPAVNELVDEILDAIAQARRAVDRPADRQYLGRCGHEEAGVVCESEIYAHPGASEVRCRVCGTTYPVPERRAWLLEQAADMLVTVREASSYLGEVGGIKVTEASIRGYLHRTRLQYRAPVEAKRFRLGDLLAVVVDESERKSA